MTSEVYMSTGLNHKRTIAVAIALVFVSLAVFSTFPAHANTPPPWTVSLDAQNLGPTDANAASSASVAKTFRVGAIVNASATSGACGSNCLQNVYAWQFGIVYDNTSVVPQGDPTASCVSYPDCGENVIAFGAQTGIGNPNWAAQIGATHAFGGSKLVDPKIDNHHNEIEVFWTFISPSGPANVFPVVSSTVQGNLLASVSFELITQPGAPIGFSLRDLKFIDPSASVIPNIGAGAPVSVTISNNPPVAGFTASSIPSGDPSCIPITGSNCSAFAVNFDGSTSSDVEDGTVANPSGFFWDFGDGTQDLGVQGAIAIHDYGIAGSFNATLRVVDSAGATGSARDGIGAVIINAQPSHVCSDVDSSTGQLSPCRAQAIAPSPILSIACASGRTAGMPFTCTATATSGTPPYTSFSWSLPSSCQGSSTSSTISVSCSVKGSYTISGTVIDSAGMSASASGTFAVAPQPLTVSVQCPSSGLTAGKPFACVVSASGGTAPYAGVGPQMAVEPVKGTFAVLFSVKDSNFQNSVGSATVTIAAQPLAVAVSCPSSGITAGKPFNCNVSATGGTAPYQGTGVFTVVEPVKGTFTENFAVTDANAAFASGSASVVVNPQPVGAVFTFSGNFVAGAPISFAASANGGTSPYGFSWSFGDSSTGSGSNVSHSYAAGGSYMVTLTVTDANGASIVLSQQVAIQELTASFTESASTVPTQTSIQFDASGSSSTGVITSFSWNFGDSNTGSGVTISHSYSAAGNYTVTLTVMDNNGLVSTASALKVITDRPPAASFTFAPGSPITGQAVSCSAAASVDPDGTVVNYLWSFGDSTTGSGVAPSHVYTSAGTFTINLVVTDNSGNTGSASAVITVVSPVGAHAALTHWSAKAFIEHESLSKNPTNSFLAYAVNDGNKSVWVYAKFHVVLDTGASGDVYTPVIQLAPGQTINGKTNPNFSAVFTPPITGGYSATATLFYSASTLAPPIGDPTFSADIASAKTFSFSVVP